MAGTGPDPAANRRRRNVPEKLKVRVILPAEGRKGKAPDPFGKPEWSAAGRAYWRELWKTPQATQWGPADRQAAGRLVSLYELELSQGPSNGRSGEMRQLEMQLGLTAKAMKDLGWVVESEEPGGQQDAVVVGRGRFGGLKVVDEAS